MAGGSAADRYWNGKPNRWHKSSKAKSPFSGVPKTGRNVKRYRIHQSGKFQYKKTPPLTNPKMARFNRPRNAFTKITFYEARYPYGRGAGTNYKSMPRMMRPIALGRGGAPGRPIALGTGSRGRTQAVSRYRMPRYHDSWGFYKAGASNRQFAYDTTKFLRKRNALIAGGVALAGAGAYKIHRNRQNRKNRVRRNYKGQFAGSY